jgi:hypothetical protein
LRYRRDL